MFEFPTAEQTAKSPSAWRKDFLNSFGVARGRSGGADLGASWEAGRKRVEGLPCRLGDRRDEESSEDSWVLRILVLESPFLQLTEGEGGRAACL